MQQSLEGLSIHKSPMGSIFVYLAIIATIILGGDFFILSISNKLNITEGVLSSHDKAKWLSINDIIDFQLLLTDIFFSQK